MARLSSDELERINEKRISYRYDLSENKKGGSYSVMCGIEPNRNKVFFDHNFQIEHRMCLVGQPTIGKTAILDYLLYEWNQKTMLRQYKWVFKFTRDDLTNTAYETLENLISDVHVSGEEYVPAYFKSCLSDPNCTDKILLMFDDIDTYSKELYDKVMTDAKNVCCDIILTSKSGQSDFHNIVISGLSEFGQRQFIGKIISKWGRAPVDDTQYERYTHAFFANLDKVADLKELCKLPLMLKYAFKSILLRHADRYQSERDYRDSDCIGMLLERVLRSYLVKHKNVSKYILSVYLEEDVQKDCDEELLFMQQLAISLLLNKASLVDTTVAYVEMLRGKQCVCRKKLTDMGLIYNVSPGVDGFVSEVLHDYFIAQFLVKYLVKKYPFAECDCAASNLTCHTSFDGISPPLVRDIITEHLMKNKVRVVEYMREMLDNGHCDTAQKQLEEWMSSGAKETH